MLRQFLRRLPLLRPFVIGSRTLVARSRAYLDFQRAKARLVDRSADEKELLQNVSLKVSPLDSMYVLGHADHYLLVGLSAIRCIEAALDSAGIRRGGIKSVLDFPVGYGRVLRFLKLKFPQVRISGAELDCSAMKFCIQEFSIESISTGQDFSQLSASSSFDLIWCGSLVTHINEDSAIALLRFFRDHLTERGICVFSTHGEQSAEWIRQKANTYGLTVPGQKAILRLYEQTGYGYADYPDVSGYGISLAASERMRTLISSLGSCIFFQPTAWDHHHDVYGFTR